MKDKQPKTKRLKAWLVSYTIGEGESQKTKSVAVFGYDKKEVGDVFIVWLQAKRIYDKVGGVVVQPIKNKRYTQEYLQHQYTRQSAFLKELYAKCVNERKVDA